MATTQLVQIAALGHQHIVRAKLNPRRHAGREFNHRHVGQIKMAVLHIADTQVWAFDERTFVLLAEGKATLNFCDAFQAD